MLDNIDIEKHCIAALLKNPPLYYDVATLINSSDFFYESNRRIFEVIKSLILENVTPDAVLVAKKISELGITLPNNIKCYDYLNSMSLMSFSESNGVRFFQELKAMSMDRDVYEMARTIGKEARTNTEINFDVKMAKYDNIYASTTQSYQISNRPENLFECAEVELEELANNPVDELGFATPYPDFNRLFGGLMKKNLYYIAARPENGKSTWMADLMYKTCNIVHPNTKCLMLDTEMEKLDIIVRLVASISGVPFWYLRTGNWKKYPEYAKKAKEAFSKIKKFNFDHIKVGNRTIDEVISIIRRWYYQNGRGQDAIVCYDYLKLTGETISESWKEYQVMGDKVDKLKKLAEELDVPVLTAIQLNRAGENTNKKSSAISDDASAIAITDRLNWFASGGWIWRRKTADEIALDGVENGTHKLIRIKTRFQGRDAAGHFDFTPRTIDGKVMFVSNYLSFKVDNFDVQEVGSLDNILKGGKNKLDVQTDSPEEVEF